MIKIKNENNGITIVEALVTILILAISIPPILNIMITSVKLSGRVKNNLIASQLAQEGVEIVRSIRDSNWFEGLASNSGLSDGTYRVDWNSTSLISQGTNPPLNINTSGLYTYASIPGTEATSFRRLVTITNDPTIACNCELRIVSTITWVERGQNRSVSVESHLFNWY